ncbi:aldoxime dehydratase [Paenarthrobacter sp. 4246]
MESSIPAHLMVERTRPKRVGDRYTPPYPSYSVRFGEGVSSLVCAFLGVQSRHPLSMEAKAASAGMWELCAQENGPISREHAVHTDEQGFDNQVIIAYWDDAGAYRRWFEKHRDAVIGAGLKLAGYGRWIEAVTPEARGFETLYSSNTFPEGVARMATGGFSGEIQEHGYWGSMRDRLPIAQSEALEPAGNPFVPENPRIVRVEPHDNLAIIRSGQNWSLCDDAERASYFGDVEPQLKAGMDFLTTEGASIGCYSNRYMTSSDGNGNVLQQSFGLSFWHSLEDMERWAESHPTHVAIFMSAMKFLQANAGARLLLSHEVAVVSREQQYYEYNNCHAATGMLGASRPQTQHPQLKT